jgi:hypothetical protein
MPLPGEEKMLKEVVALLFTAMLLFMSSVSATHAGGTIIRVTSTDPGTGGPECKLRDAITAANNAAIAGGCDGTGIGPFVVVLKPDALYTLKFLDNNSTNEGPNGLPLITGNMTIQGNGATIERRFGFNEKEIPFRFFQVKKGGMLTLRDLALQEGRAEIGGAILNQGTVIAKNVKLFSNHGSCGGAVSNDTGARLKATGSTFSHNDAHG